MPIEDTSQYGRGVTIEYEGVEGTVLAHVASDVGPLAVLDDGESQRLVPVATLMEAADVKPTPEPAPEPAPVQEVPPTPPADTAPAPEPVPPSGTPQTIPPTTEPGSEPVS